MKGLCDQSLPQMGPLPTDEVGMIIQHVRKEEGRQEGKDGVAWPVGLDVHGAMGCG